MIAAAHTGVGKVNPDIWVMRLDGSGLRDLTSSLIYESTPAGDRGGRSRPCEHRFGLGTGQLIELDDRVQEFKPARKKNCLDLHLSISDPAIWIRLPHMFIRPDGTHVGSDLISWDMNCTVCASPLPDGARFCPSCGAS